MSSIDERIVQMRFDNREFEQNASTTMSTLEKLREKLRFEKTDDGVRNLKNAFNGMNFGDVENSLDAINSKFSTLGIAGMEVIRRITNAAIDMGEKLGKALTIQPVLDGFAEYENQINSTQTIIANTGRSIEDVTKALDDLNEYADLTIYDFGNMTRSAGMFTAAIGNQPDALEKSTKALKGIGNWAAYAGADRQTFNRITYQLSQGAAAGAIRLMDWRSVETAAGMSGANYRKAFIETAEAMGVLEKGSVTVEGFRDSLKDGWLTADVFFETMAKFADDPDMTAAATQVKTFTQLIDTLKEALGTGWATSFRYIIGNFEEAKELWSGVKEELEGIINPASEARNEMLKFWHDNGGRDAMIDAVKALWKNLESIGSTIKNIGGNVFGEIFGTMSGQRLVDITIKIRDFFKSFKVSEGFVVAAHSVLYGFFNVVGTGVKAILGFGQALKMLWDAAEPGRQLFNVIAASIGNAVTSITEILSGIGGAFKNFGGLQALSNGFANIFNGIMTALAPVAYYISQVFESIYNSDFVQYIASRLTIIALAFQKLTASINFSAIGRILVTVLSGLWTVISGLAGLIRPVIDGLVTFIANLVGLGDATSSAIGSIRSFSDAFATFKDGIAGWFEKHGFSEIFADLSRIFYDLGINLTPISEKVSAIRSAFQQGNWYEGVKVAFIMIVSAIDALRRTLVDFITNKTIQAFTSLWSGILWIFGKIGQGIQYVIDKIKDFLHALSDGSIGGIIKTLLTLWALFNAADLIKNLNDIVKGFKNRFLKPIKIITDDLAKSIAKVGKSFIDGLVTPFEPLMQKQKAEALKSFAASVGILTVALIALSYTDFGKLQGGLLILGTLMGEMVGFERALMAFNSSVTVGKKGFAGKFGSSFIKDAAGLFIMAMALKSLAQIPFEQLANGLAGIGLLMVELYMFTEATTTLSTGVKGLISLAIAVGLLTGSVKEMSKLDFNALITGLAGLAGILIGLGMFLALTSGLATMSFSSAVGLVAVAAAIKILGGVVTSLGSMEFPRMIQGLLGLAGALAGIIIFLKLTSGMQTMSIKSAVALLLVAESVKILGRVVTSLGSMDFPSLLNGLAGLAGILIGLYIFLEATSKMNKLSIATAASLLIMSAAISMLGGVVKNLGGMSMGEVITGLVGLAGAMLVLVGAAKILDGTSPMLLVAAAAMVVMAAAVALITVPMMIFANMPFDKLLNGLAGVAGAILIFGVAGSILGSIALPMLAAGAAMVVMAAAVWLLVPPIIALAAIPFEKLMSAILGLAGVFLVFGAAGAILGPLSGFMLAAAGGILALAGSAAVAGASLILIGTGLKVLAGGIRTIADLILAMLDNILSCIPIIGDDIHQTITQHRKQLKEDFPEEEGKELGTNYAEAVGDGMKEGFESVGDATEGMVDTTKKTLNDGAKESKSAGKKIGTAVAQGYSESEPEVKRSFKSVTDSVTNENNKQLENGAKEGGNGFVSNLTEAISGGKDDVTDSGDVLTDALSDLDFGGTGNMLGSDFTKELSKYGVNIEDVIGDDWGKGAKNGFGDMTKFFTDGGEINADAFINALKGKDRYAEKAGESLTDKVKKALDKSKRDSIDAGKNVGYGYGDGIESTNSYVKRKADTLAGNSLRAIKDRIRSASPSKETRKLGKFGGLGFGLGFRDTTAYVKAQATNMADRGLYAIQSVMEHLRDSLDFNAEIDPTIRPVLDLEQIQNGVNTIGSMFNSQQLAVAGAFGMDPYAFNGIRSVTSASDRAPSGDQSVVNAIGELQGEISTLKSAMEHMKFEADGKVIGEVAYREVDRKLGNTVVRNRREGRG